MNNNNFLWIISLILWCNGFEVIRSPDVQQKLHYHHDVNTSVRSDHVTNPTLLSSTLDSQLLLHDIQEAFRIINKSNSNELIKSIYNESILNPIYIFQIPHKNSPKIIMRRSDFESPNYPNLTTAYIKLAHMSLLSKYKNSLPNNNKDSSINQKEHDYMKESIWLTSLHFENENLDKLNNNLSDIVEENLVTEKNFLNYVNKLNSKGKKYLKSPIEFINYTPPNYTPKKMINRNYKKASLGRNSIAKIRLALPTLGSGIPKIRLALPTRDIDNEWKDLGLEGWEGELTLPKYNSEPPFKEIHVIDSNNNPKTLYDFKFPGQYDFFDNDEKNTIWDLPGKVSSEPINQLFEKYNDENFKNMSILFTKDSKPEWPITNPRNAHKDNHIYIARVNDPFGHSTKWNLSNSSSNGIIKEDRRKRGVVELYSMIKCSTGCDPLIFKGYGCFCGFMGSGIPVDGIDRCCKMHDKCYEYSNCPSYLEYFVPYLWKCYQGKPLCAISHGEWGGQGSCADRLCKCDLQFSRCLRKFYCPKRRAVCRTSAIRMLQNFLMIL